MLGAWHSHHRLWRAEPRPDRRQPPEQSARLPGPFPAFADALAQAAQRFGATPAQAAIAWVLSRGKTILPLIGARTPQRLAEALGTLALDLGPDAFAAFESAVPDGAAAGTRYAEAQMQWLDSERASAA